MIDYHTSPKDLAALLGTTLRNINNLAYVKNTSEQYEIFTINKKNGGVRIIFAPNDRLKNIQSRLADILTSIYKPHPAASAFIEGRGIIYNAEKHVKKATVFNIDLVAFYDQIHFGRVMGLLMARPYSLQKETAQLIANLCCVDKKIPQGAPTSPVISNMICRTLDRELSLFAKNNQAQYSRYADDITFSFRSLKENKIVQAVEGDNQPSEKLKKYIEKNGFSINDKKTRYQTYKQRQTVTGLKVNEKINVDRRYIRTTKAMIFSLSKGIEAVNDKYRKTNKAKEDTPLAMMVIGRLNFIGMVKGIESTVYQGLAKKFNNLELDIKATVTPHHTKRERTKLPFFEPSNKARLEACVWVVDFDGVDDIGEEEEFVQGTAFMLAGQRIFTASHVFKSAGYPKYCNLFKVTEPFKKYKAKLIRENTTSDIAELKFIDNEVPNFNFLNISENAHVNSGYEVAVVGFPQYRESNKTVSIRNTHVVNTFIKSTFEHKEVAVDIHSGNSGGPVVDGYLGVVGIAVLGMTVSDNGIEGTNAFVSAKHIFDNLVDVAEIETTSGLVEGG